MPKAAKPTDKNPKANESDGGGRRQAGWVGNDPVVMALAVEGQYGVTP